MKLLSITLLLFLLAYALVIVYVDWSSAHIFVQPNIARVCSAEIKKAMLKMGPYKEYRILADETLQVKVNGKWLRLRYEKKENK